ncbi:MAG: DNRLRE domain-containing protein [Gemmatimonadetes bacterium]|nr:DNRLRE domain-containing protein [Gemmatimonadota bacterium]MCC7132964.1 DNRLRE domain-containing protein [Gemmatimonadales bacterium]
MRSLPRRIPSRLWSAPAALALLMPVAAAAQIAPPTGSKPILVADLKANADARVQGNVATNFANGDLVVGLPDKVAFLHFDLKALPAGAVIQAAELVVSFKSLSSGSNPVEVGKVQGTWREGSVNATNQPTVQWHGVSRNVTPGATAVYDVKGPVTAILAGEPNHGFALRGNGPLMYGYSRETAQSPSQQPTLRIRYIVP